MVDIQQFDQALLAYAKLCAGHSTATELSEAGAQLRSLYIRASMGGAQVDTREDVHARIELARRAGLSLRVDGKFGSDHYQSVTGSWPALIRFAISLATTPQTAQLNAAYAALDAVCEWAQKDGHADEPLLALLLKHGVHPRGEQA
jgi:hypothetical protein